MGHGQWENIRCGGDLVLSWETPLIGHFDINEDLDLTELRSILICSSSILVDLGCFELCIGLRSRKFNIFLGCRRYESAAIYFVTKDSHRTLT